MKQLFIIKAEEGRASIGATSCQHNHVLVGRGHHERDEGRSNGAFVVSHGMNSGEGAANSGVGVQWAEVDGAGDEVAEPGDGEHCIPTLACEDPCTSCCCCGSVDKAIL